MAASAAVSAAGGFGPAYCASASDWYRCRRTAKFRPCPSGRGCVLSIELVAAAAAAPPPRPPPTPGSGRQSADALAFVIAARIGADLRVGAAQQRVVMCGIDRRRASLPCSGAPEQRPPRRRVRLRPTAAPRSAPSRPPAERRRTTREVELLRLPGPQSFRESAPDTSRDRRPPDTLRGTGSWWLRGRGRRRGPGCSSSAPRRGAACGSAGHNRRRLSSRPHLSITSCGSNE